MKLEDFPSDPEMGARVLERLRRRRVHAAKAFALYCLGLLFLGLLARVLGCAVHS